MKFTIAAVFSSLFAVQVAAHGYVDSVKIGGKTYKGNDPTSGKIVDSPIRRISTQDPNYGATKPHIICGPNAKAAKLVAAAKPGDAVEFVWKTGQGGRWPHNTGPMLTYLASCGNTPCDKFDPTGAKWFKIHEAGRKPNNNAQWVQQDIMNGAPLKLTLPSDLKSGGYLMRHEIIALHLAPQGKAEFYPSCTQIQVSGNGNGVPQSFVSFPGAYKDEDPGIHDKNVFNSKEKYPFPGGKVVSLVAGSGSSSGSSTSDDKPAAASPSSTKAAATASSTKPAAAAPSTTAKSTSTSTQNSSTGSGSGKCRQRKRSAAPEPVSEPEAAPSPEGIYAEALKRAEINATAARRSNIGSIARRHSKFVRLARRSH